MNISDKAKKGIQMTSIVLAFGFTAAAVSIAIGKRANLKMTDLLIFAGGSIVGGFVGANLLKETTTT